MFGDLWWWLLGATTLVVVVAVLAAAAVLIVRSKSSPEAPSALRQAKNAVEELVPARFRMGVMFIATFVLGGLIFWLARQQIAVIIYKASLMTMAAIVGYWADRTAFPHSRPNVFPDPEIRWRYEIRRAYIICAAMLTAGLGA